MERPSREPVLKYSPTVEELHLLVENLAAKSIHIGDGSCMAFTRVSWRHHRGVDLRA